MGDCESVEQEVEKLITGLKKAAKESNPNTVLLYNAAKWLEIYNLFFTMNWTDVAIAEERIRECV